MRVFVLLLSIALLAACAAPELVRGGYVAHVVQRGASLRADGRKLQLLIWLFHQQPDENDSFVVHAVFFIDRDRLVVGHWIDLLPEEIVRIGVDETLDCEAEPGTRRARLKTSRLDDRAFEGQIEGTIYGGGGCLDTGIQISTTFTATVTPSREE